MSFRRQLRAFVASLGEVTPDVERTQLEPQAEFFMRTHVGRTTLRKNPHFRRLFPEMVDRRPSTPQVEASIHA